jgi:hypothetical protein
MGAVSIMTRPTRMLTAVATGLVALASASTATAAPRTERLAFGTDVQGNVDVYTVRTDGRVGRSCLPRPKGVRPMTVHNSREALS